MFECKNCKFFTNSNFNYIRHCNTKKHLNMIKLKSDNNPFFCVLCNREYMYQSGFSNHKKKCKQINPTNIINDIRTSKLFDNTKKINTDTNNVDVNIVKENEQMKENYEFKLKINALENKTLQLENELLKCKLVIQGNTNNSVSTEINTNSHNTTNNTNNNTTNNINTTVKLSKIDNLNINFNNVIDIDTFINNFENEDGLTNKQTETLLYNRENGGMESCISSLVHYMKDSMLKQYKKKGMDIQKTDVILPMLLSDKCLRDHFEKNINGNWGKTTSIENIIKIINITESQIFKHHNKYMSLSNAQKKKLANGILKSSNYFTEISKISQPELYKKPDTIKSNQTVQPIPLEHKQIELNTSDSSILIPDTKQEPELVPVQVKETIDSYKG